MDNGTITLNATTTTTAGAATSLAKAVGLKSTLISMDEESRLAC